MADQKAAAKPQVIQTPESVAPIPPTMYDVIEIIGNITKRTSLPRFQILEKRFLIPLPAGTGDLHQRKRHRRQWPAIVLGERKT